MENNIQYRVFYGLKNDKDAVFVRTTVFIEEQGFKLEFDDIDDVSTHIVIYVNGEPAATGRTFFKDDDNIIGRVAVLKQYRGKGLGEKIIESLEAEIKKSGGNTAKLSSQYHAKGFYEKQGYNVFGDIYYDENCAHIAMKKEL